MKYTAFVDDAEKMRDFWNLTKEDFLKSYSYLTEKEWNLTAEAVKIKRVDLESFEAAREDGWNPFECCHGYGLFEGEYPTKRGMIDGLHIERIDIMNTWGSDITAARDAEKHGYYKIIRDIPGLYHVFIDTPENRAHISKQWEALK